MYYVYLGQRAVQALMRSLARDISLPNAFCTPSNPEPSAPWSGLRGAEPETWSRCRLSRITVFLLDGISY